MSDLAHANGSTGVVWKMAKKVLVRGRPAQAVCTIACVTGPAARDGRLRGGDKLVAVRLPQAQLAPAEASAPGKTNRAARICVVGHDVAAVRGLLAGKAGEPVELEFLRAAEWCPSEEALKDASFRKPRNTITVRLVREPIVDTSLVTRSQTVGVKPVGDLLAERKLEMAMDSAYRQKEAVLEAKKERRTQRYLAKLARKDQLAKHAEETRRQEEDKREKALEAAAGAARQQRDAKQAMISAHQAALLTVLQSPVNVELQHLGELDLSNSCLASLPEYLVGMTKLKHLDLSHNRLESLPDWISELKLEVLAAGNNKLLELPTKMGQMRTLAHLDVRMNPGLHTPPPNVFDRCEASKLHIGFVDPSFALTYLLLCHGDALSEDSEDNSTDEEVVPDAKEMIWSPGVDGALSAEKMDAGTRKLRSSNIDSKPHNWMVTKNCTIVLVGEACSGKTGCLFHLRHPDFCMSRLASLGKESQASKANAMYKPTRGVHICEWTPFEGLKQEDREYLKLLVLDCAGSPNFRDYLDLSMPSRALYLLFWAPNVADSNADAAMDTEECFLRKMTEYWLHTIQVWAPGSNVLLVCNAAVGQGLQDRLISAVQHQAKRTIRAMSARVKVNLLQEGRSVLVDVGSGAGMTDLRNAILAALAKGGKVPRNFLDLNRHFLEHRPGGSDDVRPARAMLESDLIKIAIDKCGLRDSCARIMALDHLLQWQNTKAFDLKHLGIADKLYMNVCEIARVACDLVIGRGTNQELLLLHRVSEASLRSMWGLRSGMTDDEEQALRKEQEEERAFAVAASARRKAAAAAAANAEEERKVAAARSATLDNEATASSEVLVYSEVEFKNKSVTMMASKVKAIDSAAKAAAAAKAIQIEAEAEAIREKEAAANEVNATNLLLAAKRNEEESNLLVQTAQQNFEAARAEMQKAAFDDYMDYESLKKLVPIREDALQDSMHKLNVCKHSLREAEIALANVQYQNEQNRIHADRRRESLFEDHNAASAEASAAAEELSEASLAAARAQDSVVAAQKMSHEACSRAEAARRELLLATQKTEDAISKAEKILGGHLDLDTLHTDLRLQAPEIEEEEEQVNLQEHLRCRQAAEAMHLIGPAGDNLYFVPHDSCVIERVDARSLANSQALLTLKVDYEFLPGSFLARLVVALTHHVHPGTRLDYIPLSSSCPTKFHHDHSEFKSDYSDVFHRGDRRIRQIASMYSSGVKVTLAVLSHGCRDSEGTKRSGNETDILIAAFSHCKHLTLFLDCLIHLERTRFLGLSRLGMHFLAASSGGKCDTVLFGPQPQGPDSRNPKTSHEWIPWPIDIQGVPIKVESLRNPTDSGRDRQGVFEPERHIQESLSRIRMAVDSQAAMLFMIHSGSRSLFPNKHDFPLSNSCLLSLRDAGLYSGRRVWVYKADSTKRKSPQMEEAIFKQGMRGDQVQVEFAHKQEQIVPGSWLIRDAESEAQKMVLQFARFLDSSGSNGIPYDDRLERDDCLMPVDLASVAMIFVDPVLRAVSRARSLIQRVFDRRLPTILVITPDDDGFMPESNQFSQLFGGRSFSDHPCLFAFETVQEATAAFPSILAQLHRILSESKGQAPIVSPNSYFLNEPLGSWSISRGENCRELDSMTSFRPDGLNPIPDFSAVVCPHCIQAGIYPPYSFGHALHYSCSFPQGLQLFLERNAYDLHRLTRLLTVPVECPLAKTQVGDVLDLFPIQVMVFADDKYRYVAREVSLAAERILGVRCLSLLLGMEEDTELMPRLLQNAGCVVIVLPIPSMTFAATSTSSGVRFSFLRNILKHTTKDKIIAVHSSSLDTLENLQTMTALAAAGTLVSIARLPSAEASALTATLHQGDSPMATHMRTLVSTVCNQDAGSAPLVAAWAEVLHSAVDLGNVGSFDSSDQHEQVECQGPKAPADGEGPGRAASAMKDVTDRNFTALCREIAMRLSRPPTRACFEM